MPFLYCRIINLYGKGEKILIRQVIGAYRLYAPVYDILFGAILEPGRKAMTAAVRSLRPQVILEIGVGTGLTLKGYPPTSQVVGVDLSEDMLLRAERKRRAMPGRNITLKQEDAEALSFEDASFDCVTLPYVLSVTPNPGRLVEQVRRVCKKGGTIILVNHFSGSRFWWLMEQVARGFAGKVGFHSEFCYAKEVLSYDWRIESVRTVNLFGLSKLVIIRNE